MANRDYDRAAITRRAHEIRREAGTTFSAAMKAAWAEAKGTSIPVSWANRPLAALNNCAQPGGLAAALRRYGVDVDGLSARAAAFIERLTEAVYAAAVRKQARVDALLSGAGVFDAEQGPTGDWGVR
jgi:hypothetical protein